MNKDIVTAESFARAVAEHTMTVLRDDDAYRHLRFGKPGTIVNSFSIVTWPGYLAFTGDMGDYVFKRLDDMMEFFRGHGPNPDYWSEKCVAAGHEGIKEYSAELAHEMIDEAVVEASRDLPPGDAVALEEQVVSDVLNFLHDGEAATHARLRDFYAEEAPDVFSDSWEWDFKVFTYHFVWACHAIPWAIAQYDQAKASGAT